MSTELSDTQSHYIYTYYVKGRTGQGQGERQYELVKLSEDGIERMVLRYPEPVSEEDRALKEFYAQCMYELCGFGGNGDCPSWNDFKKKYSF